MKDVTMIKADVLEYVAYINRIDGDTMKRFFTLSSDIREVFPDTSVRKIEEQIGTKGFSKTQIALGLKLVNDFNKAPDMSIHSYSKHAGFLSKIEFDKRLSVAGELHSAQNNAKEIDAIKARFGFGKATVSSEATSTTADFTIQDRNIDAFLERVIKANKLEYLLTKALETKDADLALKNAKKAITDKAKAKRKLALRNKAA